MKVMQSTLSMEAHSFYRDVRLAGSAATGRSAATAAADGAEQFRLNIDEDARQDESTSQGAASPSTASHDSPPDQPATGGIQRTEFLGEAVTPGRSTLQFSTIETRQETASLTFQSAGNVVTGDGREIDFSLKLFAERSSSYTRLTLAEPLLLDPLVLSFSDGLSALSDTSFTFDLDADGSDDNIAALSGGSGFLALDRNGDGVVNDGTELFGPVTGDGYGDLAEYDLDGNLWIDENDPVFDELLVWMGAGGDESSLVSLREAGVGAIALASTESDFTLKNSSGEVLGKIARAGIFLMEDGQPRSLQEIDFNLELGTELAADDDTITSIDEAVAALRQMITVRRRQVHELLHRRSLGLVQRDGHGDGRDENLSERFWEWQNRRLG